MSELFDLFYQLFTCSSRFLNVLHFGKSAETFSSRCYRCRRRSTYFSMMYNLINCMAYWLYAPSDHCKDSYYSIIEHGELPVDFWEAQDDG